MSFVTFTVIRRSPDGQIEQGRSTERMTVVFSRVAQAIASVPRVQSIVRSDCLETVVSVLFSLVVVHLVW